jgi:DNA-directed RNA polymerase specialized sigma24 family protein
MTISKVSGEKPVTLTLYSCQSVLASFFARAAAGCFELETPDQLLRLLAVMARNKLADQVDHQRAECRDVRRVAAGRAADRNVVGPAATPSRQLAARELLQEVRRRLSSQEAQLLQWRDEGREWAAIAADLGGNAEALRKRLDRALGRVARELGMDEVAHA